VRGIGSGQGDPAVVTCVDGVPQLFPGGANFPLLCVERIEFLRGPQGTLYGRNSLGGLIQVITRKPPDSGEIEVQGTIGSFRLRELGFVLGGPFVDDALGGSLAGRFHRRDGYTRNDYTGHYVDSRDDLFGQGQLLFTPDEKNEFRFSILCERTRDGGFTLSDLPGLKRRPWRINQDFEGVTQRDVILPALTFVHSGDAVEFTSITSFEYVDVYETSDFDFTAIDGVRRETEESYRAFAQELRVSSPPDQAVDPGGDARLKWLAGVMYFHADSDRSAANEYRPGGVGILFPAPGIDQSEGDFTDQGLSVFGQATLTVFDVLDLGAGLRFDYERKDASLHREFVSAGFPIPVSSGRYDQSDSEVLPRFDLAWRVSPEVVLYGLAAKGFKAGGFNLDAPTGRIPYSPETTWTYEGGVKTSCFDGRLTANAAYYFIDWDDMQLSQFDAAVGGYVTNAGASTSQGVEFSVLGRPAGGLDLFASLGTADTRFKSYRDPYGADVSGNALPFAPRSTFSAGAQFCDEICPGVRGLVGGEYAATGQFYYDAGNRESEQYAQANFRLGVEGEHWRVQFWLRNAFDRDAIPVAFQPSPADPSVFVGENGAPRTYGLTVTLTF
jgi:iron complex outermembrane receptor protein